MRMDYRTAGVAALGLMVVVTTADGLTRPGYSTTRHWMSHLRRALLQADARNEYLKRETDATHASSPSLSPWRPLIMEEHARKSFRLGRYCHDT